MSTLATNYRLFHANTNTITALTLYDGTGAALTVQSIADGTDDPVGWKTKVISFAEPTEAVFVTPVFLNPNAPVPVFLTYESGQDINATDETTFNVATPGRPTAFGAAHRQYQSVSLEDPSRHTWAITPPLDFTPKVKARTKDPVTGLRLYGNDFYMLCTGTMPDNLEVQCDVEDITDAAGFVDVAYTNVTAYAESSVGKVLLKLDAEIIPQDGFIHALRFRIRYNFSGDVSTWAEGSWQKAAFALPPPNDPKSVSVHVIRDRSDVVPDRIQLTWELETSNPGDMVELYAIDAFGKRHLLGEESDNAVTSMTVEDVSRFYSIPRPPAVQTPYRFGVLAKNRSSTSNLVLTAAPVLLTCKIRSTDPLSPDEIAGTAETVTHLGFMTKASAAAYALTTPGITVEQKAALSSLIGYATEVIFDTIKGIVAKGGSITIDDFGTFKAKWHPDHYRFNVLTGDSVLIPAARQQAFMASKGYKVGTMKGQVITDLQAKALV